MRAAWYERNGSARDVLKIEELAKPVIEPGKVMVRVHAAGANPSDTKRRARVPLLPGNKQQIPHQDGAGVIKEIGEGVSASRLGQRVWIYEALFAGKAGCAAQYVVPGKNAVELPENISFEVGACLGVPALTAHREGWLKPTIASPFPLNQIVAAHEASESGKSIGKVVIHLN